jgi:hypothetical protein
MASTLTGKAAKVFSNQHFFKFAATVNKEGTPNVIPLLSAKMVEPDTIAFVRFMVWKTRKNFEANKKISFACSDMKGRGYLAKGEFQEWQTQGELLQEFENEIIYRYNAYMGANVLGIIKVKDVTDFGCDDMILPTIRKLVDKISGTKKRGTTSPMPAQVMEKWENASSIKFFGLIDTDGEPIAVPAQSITAPSPDTIEFQIPKDPKNPLSNLKEGQLMAASMFALDPVAFQVKGTFQGVNGNSGKKTGSMKVTEVYSASAPIPGRRIYPAESYGEDE